jgi:L-alanine-DL-glutamate epimerase-like enolase superfamily enzyme
MDGRMYGNHGAKAAIEIALLDIAGLSIAKPVHALLGDKKRSRMPLLGVIGGGDREGDLRDAEKKKAAGVTAYKIKVGIDTAENDAARTREICKTLGNGMLISADANQGFSTAHAITYVHAVEDRGRFLRAAGCSGRSGWDGSRGSRNRNRDRCGRGPPLVRRHQASPRAQGGVWCESEGD